MSAAVPAGGEHVDGFPGKGCGEAPDHYSANLPTSFSTPVVMPPPIPGEATVLPVLKLSIMNPIVGEYQCSGLKAKLVFPMLVAPSERPNEPSWAGPSKSSADIQRGAMKSFQSPAAVVLAPTFL